ncbi:MAG: CBS domain-containing protein [Pseudomonadota bacterium]
MNELSPFKVSESATLLQAVEKIEKNRSRAAIVESDGKVIGVISEGDIMRALLQGANIHSPIESFIIYSFKYLTDRDLPQARKLFAKHLITLLPVLDDDFRLVGVITLRDILNAV